MLSSQELGIKVKSIRKQYGLSQEELGKILQKSHAAISDIERGKTELSLRDLYLLAEYLHISISHLIESPYNVSINIKNSESESESNVIETNDGSVFNLTFNSTVPSKE